MKSLPLTNKMLLIVRGICDDIEMKMKNKKSIKNRAEQYVIQNYNDVNLSVAKIADELCVHQAYLSATYKEQAGEGLLEFINKVRVENAKELLQTTDNNMPTIAGSVGYINVRTFLRVFKKYVGITPTQFKKMD